MIALSTDLVGDVDELQSVQVWSCDGPEVREGKALQGLHDHKVQGDGSVFIKS